MTDRPPEFDELVGTEIEPDERERLQHVHDLLIAAGPPPELAPGSSAPATGASVLALRSRRGALVAIAAALGVLAFAVGFLAGGGTDDYTTFKTVAMKGTASAVAARATIELFDADAAGNWPMELEVSGLEPPANGGLYELWLTRDGRGVALCGSFLADPDGSTVVPMNAPWKLADFDGWVVVQEGSDTPLLTT